MVIFIGKGEALSSISLPIERAPPLSNSLHPIYLVPPLFVFVYCINFSVSLYQFSVTLLSLLCSNMRILTGFVVVQENIKPEVLKVQTELASSVR